MQAQLLSVQMLQLPDLLTALSQDGGFCADTAMLLATGEGQKAASHVFKVWQEEAAQQSYMTGGVSAAHGPALIAFAAAASLLQSLPDASGQFV